MFDTEGDLQTGVQTDNAMCWDGTIYIYIYIYK
jgi:hypothetical protein